MSKTFDFKILTPGGSVLEDTVSQVVAKTTDGEVGILPGHIPLITPLDSAPLKYWKDGDIRVAAVLGGIMKVSSDGVTIISDHAALAENIDAVIAQKEKEIAEARIAQKKDKVDIQKAELDLQKLLLNLQVVELVKRIKSK